MSKQRLRVLLFAFMVGSDPQSVYSRELSMFEPVEQYFCCYCCCFGLVSLAVPHGLWNLSSPPGDRTHTPCIRSAACPTLDCRQSPEAVMREGLDGYCALTTRP